MKENEVRNYKHIDSDNITEKGNENEKTKVLCN